MTSYLIIYQAHVLLEDRPLLQDLVRTYLAEFEQSKDLYSREPQNSTVGGEWDEPISHRINLNYNKPNEITNVSVKMNLSIDNR